MPSAGLDNDSGLAVFKLLGGNRQSNLRLDFNNVNETVSFVSRRAFIFRTTHERREDTHHMNATVVEPRSGDVRRPAVKFVLGTVLMFFLATAAKKCVAKGDWVGFAAAVVLCTAIAADVLWFMAAVTYRIMAATRYADAVDRLIDRRTPAHETEAVDAEAERHVLATIKPLLTASAVLVPAVILFTAFGGGSDDRIRHDDRKRGKPASDPPRHVTHEKKDDLRPPKRRTERGGAGGGGGVAEDAAPRTTWIRREKRATEGRPNETWGAGGGASHSGYNDGRRIITHRDPLVEVDGYNADIVIGGLRSEYPSVVSTKEMVITLADIVRTRKYQDTRVPSLLARLDRRTYTVFNSGGAGSPSNVVEDEMYKYADGVFRKVLLDVFEKIWFMASSPSYRDPPSVTGGDGGRDEVEIVTVIPSDPTQPLLHHTRTQYGSKNPETNTHPNLDKNDDPYTRLFSKQYGYILTKYGSKYDDIVDSVNAVNFDDPKQIKQNLEQIKTDVKKISDEILKNVPSNTFTVDKRGGGTNETAGQDSTFLVALASLLIFALEKDPPPPDHSRPAPIRVPSAAVPAPSEAAPVTIPKTLPSAVILVPGKLLEPEPDPDPEPESESESEFEPEPEPEDKTDDSELEEYRRRKALIREKQAKEAFREAAEASVRRNTWVWMSCMGLVSGSAIAFSAVSQPQNVVASSSSRFEGFREREQDESPHADEDSSTVRTATKNFRYKCAASLVFLSVQAYAC